MLVSWRTQGRRGPRPRAGRHRGCGGRGAAWSVGGADAVHRAGRML